MHLIHESDPVKTTDAASKSQPQYVSLLNQPSTKPVQMALPNPAPP